MGNIDFEIFYANATREKLDLNMALEPGEKNTFDRQVLDMNMTNNYDKIRVITNCSNVNDEISSSDVSEVT